MNLDDLSPSELEDLQKWADSLHTAVEIRELNDALDEVYEESSGRTLSPSARSSARNKAKARWLRDPDTQMSVPLGKHARNLDIPDIGRIAFTASGRCIGVIGGIEKEYDQYDAEDIYSGVSTTIRVHVLGRDGYRGPDRCFEFMHNEKVFFRPKGGEAQALFDRWLAWKDSQRMPGVIPPEDLRPEFVDEFPPEELLP